MAARLFDHIVEDCRAAFLEFIGTILFLLLGLGGIQAAADSNQQTLAAAVTANGTDSGAQAVNTVASIGISLTRGLPLVHA